MRSHSSKPRQTFTTPEAYENQIYRELTEDFPLHPGAGPATRYEHEGLIPGKDFNPYSEAELQAMNRQYYPAPAEQLAKPVRPVHNLGAVAANTIPGHHYGR